MADMFRRRTRNASELIRANAASTGNPLKWFVTGWAGQACTGEFRYPCDIGWIVVSVTPCDIFHEIYRIARILPMKLSARNVLSGTVTEIVTGAVTSHVRIDVGGTIVTASITNEAVIELGLKVGDMAYAVVKASDVMVGKD
jgi:molybdopterin-binding protein